MRGLFAPSVVRHARRSADDVPWRALTASSSAEAPRLRVVVRSADCCCCSAPFMERFGWMASPPTRRHYRWAALQSKRCFVGDDRGVASLARRPAFSPLAPNGTFYLFSPLRIRRRSFIPPHSPIHPPSPYLSLRHMASSCSVLDGTSICAIVFLQGTISELSFFLSLPLSPSLPPPLPCVPSAFSFARFFRHISPFAFAHFLMHSQLLSLLVCLCHRFFVPLCPSALGPSLLFTSLSFSFFDRRQAPRMARRGHSS